jgi:transposase InsO family protein
LALNIDNASRKKALLLHFAGPEVYDIHDTLTVQEPVVPNADGVRPPGPADVYEATVDALTKHFDPKSSRQYNLYLFRQMKQTKGESLDVFYTRLKKQAAVCKFTDEDHEIKSQVILGTINNKLRRLALEDDDLSLQRILDKGRTLELSNQHASVMEGQTSENSEVADSEVNKLGAHKYHSGKTEPCGLCGGDYPHRGGPTRCPAYGKKCAKCRRYNHFAKCCRSSSSTYYRSDKYKPNEKSKGSEKHRSSEKHKSKSTKHKFKSHKSKVNQAKYESDSDSDEYEHEANAVHKTSGYLYATQSVSNVKTTMPTAQVKIEDTSVTMLVDTGADVNIMDETTYRKLSHSIPLQPSSLSVKPYGAPAFKVQGKFSTTVNHNESSVPARFYVAKGSDGNLMSKSLAEDLGLVQLTANSLNSSTLDFLSQHDSVFNGVGKMKNYQVRLHIDESVQPVARQHRRIPINLREKVEAAISKLEAQDIIEQVTEGPTPWVSQPVFVPKSNGSIRLCVDMRAANQAIQRTRHAVPTVDEILSDLNGAAVFSKIDLNQGYHQLELDPMSRYITTFSTHLGLYRYKRLNFGINCASEIFQHAVRSVLQGIKNVINVSDDILIYSKDVQSHKKTLKQVFERLSKHGLTVNKDKCLFLKSSLKYIGYVFSQSGVKPDPEKVKAIRQAPAPSNVSEIRSFMGMVTFCARFIPNLATISAPLMKLTHKNANWNWSPTEEKAFQDIKSALSEDGLSYYNPKDLTEIFVDTSPIGLGAILTQKSKDDPNSRRIISYASRTLSPTEQRYSQIEREALAILFACEKFKLYVLGKPFKVVTDHKPLVPMFRNSNLQLPARIERWVLCLQQFALTVTYQPGKSNPADYMSRHPDPVQISETKTERLINFIVAEHTPIALSAETIATETENDPHLQMVITAIRSGDWRPVTNKNDKDLHIIETVKDQLTVTDRGIILKGHKVVLPRSLYQQATDLAHEGHQGLVKSKTLMRSKVWFPQMDSYLTTRIKDCIPCAATNSGKQQQTPLKMSKLPTKPWTEISADFFGPLPTGEYILVVIDDYSRFPMCEVLRSTSATATIPAIDRILSTMGIPAVLRTDNGPPFNSKEFARFAETMGFKHRKITPRWPKANAEAERFMRTLKKCLQIANMKRSPWRRDLQIFLRQYRSTEHTTTGSSPHKLLFGREPDTKFDIIPVATTGDVSLRRKDRSAKSRMKRNADKQNKAVQRTLKKGDHVLIENESRSKLTPRYDPNVAVVVKTKGTCITVRHKNRLVTRNISWFKRIPKQVNNETKAQVPQNKRQKEKVKSPWAPPIVIRTKENELSQERNEGEPERNESESEPERNESESEPERNDSETEPERNDSESEQERFDSDNEQERFHSDNEQERSDSESEQEMSDSENEQNPESEKKDQPRKSKRQRQKPSYLSDYFM